MTTQATTTLTRPGLTDVCTSLRAYLVGWKGYFQFTQAPNVLVQIDKWIRHRLRALQLKHWKRGPTIHRELVSRGLSSREACTVAVSGQRWWRSSAISINIALPNEHFDRLGVPRLGA